MMPQQRHPDPGTRGSSRRLPFCGRLWGGRPLVALAALASAALLVVPAPSRAERYTRTFSWSGYQWRVRVAQREDPGQNAWGDTPANVRVRGDGKLRLAITPGPVWKSVELAGLRSLGYGRYRWVIESDLSDPRQVFALFVRDMAVSRAADGEQDVEFSRWGVPTCPPGWFVAWSKTGKAFSGFAVTSRPPYRVEIVWRPGNVRFFMGDAAGRVLLDRSASATSTGRLLYPRMSYWMLPNSPRAIVPPPMLIRSFSFQRAAGHR